MRTPFMNSFAQEELIHNFDREVSISITKILCASIAMGIVSYGALYLIAPIVNTRTVVGLLVQVAISGGVGVIVFYIIAKRLGLNEAEGLRSIILRRFGR
jgi:hypothetical protein